MANKEKGAPPGGRREFLDYALGAAFGCTALASAYPSYHFLAPGDPSNIVSVTATSRP